MQCQCHPGVEAVGTGSACGQAICRDGAANVAGELVCRQCLAVRPILTASATTAGSSSNSSMALISLLLAVLGAFGCLCAGSIGGFFLGAPAMVLGYLAHKQARERGRPGQDEGLALAGLLLGAVEVILSVLVAVLAGAAFIGSLFLSTLPQR